MAVKKVAPEIISTSILLFLMVIMLSHLRGVQLNWRGENITVDYWVLRAELLQEEEIRQLGGDLKFHRDERLANQVLMEAKKKEINDGFNDPAEFLPAQNFLLVADKIRESRVFQLIQAMPKGAVLHAHDTAIVSHSYLFHNITYRPNLYLCENGDQLRLRFFKKPTNDCDWRLLSELREANNSIDVKIAQKMSMNTKFPDVAYPDVDTAWKKFMDIFIFTTPMLTYRPIYEDYYYQGLQELYDDNVLYLELRTILPPLYDLDGKTYGPLDVARLYKNVTDRFVRDHPDFIGAKIIFAPLRRVSQETIDDYLSLARQLVEELPDFVAGFDLVGQEDKGEPLISFANKIASLNFSMNLFLHAGETKWYGSSTDQNLIDAVLLKSKRIGHGYALPKHPRIMELVNERQVGIEVNPISNQVLGLVKDMRNHPSSVLFAQNFPVVVSNDDPGLWGAKGLSYDFYEAFLGIMSKSADIRALKVLAKNSLEYSSLKDSEKTRALQLWRRKWDEYIAKLITS